MIKSSFNISHFHCMASNYLWTGGNDCDDALMIDLKMLKFFKDIGRERPIFTDEVTKGLNSPL